MPRCVGDFATPTGGTYCHVGLEQPKQGTTSPAISVALSNYGSAILNIPQIAATASFAETDTCVPSLASGATGTINVTFTPGAAGDTTGMLWISDDAPGSSRSLSLSGTGSTNTPRLTGYCFATCAGLVKDYARCPIRQPALSPGAKMPRPRLQGWILRDSMKPPLRNAAAWCREVGNGGGIGQRWMPHGQAPAHGSAVARETEIWALSRLSAI